MRHVMIVSVTALVLGACSDGSSSSSSTKDMQDIYRMDCPTMGSCQVTCRDGRVQTRSVEEIRRGDVCENGSGGGSLICVARDNDGRDPWVIASFGANGQISHLGNLVQFATQPQCSTAIQTAIQSNGQALVCASRDKDGRTPFTMARIKNDGTAVLETSMIYSTTEECASALQAARRMPNAAFICSSRDHDGRSPWSLYSVTVDAVVRQDVSFQDLQACLR